MKWGVWRIPPGKNWRVYGSVFGPKRRDLVLKIRLAFGAKIHTQSLFCLLRRDVISLGADRSLHLSGFLPAAQLRDWNPFGQSVQIET